MKGVRIEDLPPRLQEQVRKQLVLDRKNTVPDAEPEYDPHKTLENHSQVAAISTPVYIVVCCYRTSGLRWDLDNVSIKPFIDGIVEAGLLKDDSTKQVCGLLKLPFTCKTKQEERTEIEFWDAGYFENYVNAARRSLNKT